MQCQHKEPLTLPLAEDGKGREQEGWQGSWGGLQPCIPADRQQGLPAPTAVPSPPQDAEEGAENPPRPLQGDRAEQSSGCSLSMQEPQDLNLQAHEEGAAQIQQHREERIKITAQ